MTTANGGSCSNGSRGKLELSLKQFGVYYIFAKVLWALVIFIIIILHIHIILNETLFTTILAASITLAGLSLTTASIIYTNSKKIAFILFIISILFLLSFTINILFLPRSYPLYIEFTAIIAIGLIASATIDIAALQFGSEGIIKVNNLMIIIIIFIFPTNLSAIDVSFVLFLGALIYLIVLLFLISILLIYTKNFDYIELIKNFIVKILNKYRPNMLTENDIYEHLIAEYKFTPNRSDFRQALRELQNERVIVEINNKYTINPTYVKLDRHIDRIIKDTIKNIIDKYKNRVIDLKFLKTILKEEELEKIPYISDIEKSQISKSIYDDAGKINALDMLKQIANIIGFHPLVLRKMYPQTLNTIEQYLVRYFSENIGGNFYVSKEYVDELINKIKSAKDNEVLQLIVNNEELRKFFSDIGNVIKKVIITSVPLLNLLELVHDKLISAIRSIPCIIIPNLDKNLITLLSELNLPVQFRLKFSCKKDAQNIIKEKIKYYNLHNILYMICENDICEIYCRDIGLISESNEIIKSLQQEIEKYC